MYVLFLLTTRAEKHKSLSKLAWAKTHESLSPLGSFNNPSPENTEGWPARGVYCSDGHVLIAFVHFKVLGQLPFSEAGGLNSYLPQSFRTKVIHMESTWSLGYGKASQEASLNPSYPVQLFLSEKPLFDSACREEGGILLPFVHLNGSFLATQVEVLVLGRREWFKVPCLRVQLGTVHTQLRMHVPWHKIRKRGMEGSQYLSGEGTHPGPGHLGSGTLPPDGVSIGISLTCQHLSIILQFKCYLALASPILLRLPLVFNSRSLSTFPHHWYQHFLGKHFSFGETILWWKTLPLKFFLTS